MSQKTFHLESYLGKPNGLIDEPVHQVEAGDTFQMFEGGYGTATVLGIAPADTHGDVYVRMARPYCYASSVGTTSPTPLVGVEVYEVTFAHLVLNHKRTTPASMIVKP